MRSPAQMDIVQLDISNKCFLACTHCTRLISHQSKKWEMSVEQFEAGVRSMEGWDAPGKVLGVIAGEPTLNSNFEAISRAFAANWGGPLTANGREPITNLEEFAQQRLFDRSNGRGLWTSFGPGAYKHWETILEVYSHFNVNTHETRGQHQAMLISRKDYCEKTGISDDEWLRNRDNCFVQNLWSASINDKGAYPCEVMASIDRLYFDGANAWPVEAGWWKRTPAEFGKMLDLCNYCSLAQRCPSRVDSEERDIISPESVKLLTEAKSPAVIRNEFDLWDGTGNRLVTTKDSYVGESRRVGPDHDSLFPKRLSMVVVSVGTGDILSKTLPMNAPLFDEVVVVTTKDDVRTDLAILEQPLDMSHVKLVQSDRCYEDSAAFNKGKMLNDGIAALKNPDWIVCTDADVFLHRNLRNFLKSHALNPGCLYYTDRYDIAPGQQPQHLHDNICRQPNGFFQLWNRRAIAIRDRFPQVMFETFCSAGGVDSAFMQRWPAAKRIYIPEIPVLHAHHGSELGARWNGVSPRPGTWRQIGVITANSPEIAIPSAATEVRLTETRGGTVCHLHNPPVGSVGLPVVNGALQFGDQFLIEYHVHVAAFFPGASAD